MAKRFTDTEKYKDSWFLDLDATEKLFFYYLIDNVDNAGFYEVSFRHITFHLGFSKNEILGAIEGLGRGLLGAKNKIDKGSKIYLKNFLQHQKTFPLNPYNAFHKSALKIFNDNIEFVEAHDFLKNLTVIGAKTKDKKIVENIDTTLLKFLKKEEGLDSPLVKVKVKVKEKGKVEVEVEEKVKVKVFGKSENLLKISKLETELINSFSWKETICRNVNETDVKITLDQIDDKIAQFIKTIEGDGEDEKDLKDAKKHFNRWLMLDIKNTSNEKQQNSNNQSGPSSAYRAKIAERLGVVSA